MHLPGTKPLKAATLGLGLLSLLSCWSPIATGALTSVDDSAATQPNTPVVIPVLMNDAVSTSNTTAILRVTQPSHGSVIRNSTPTSHAELTPLFGFAARQLSNTVVQVAITNLYPWYLTNGVWKSMPTNTPANPDQNWIGGFFPGSLWMIYEQTGDANFSHWAQMWQAALAPEQYSTAKDDVGFIINSSFGNGYRITGNPRSKDILTQTRRSFTNRWNAVVGCLADDRLLTPPPFEVDIDTMMNTEIFYRADLDRDTTMLAMANSHAGRTLTNHLRADGSTFMRVIYDGVTNGTVLLKDNRVPIGALDTWARGHSWATHSFALLYGATGDGRFLDTAKRVADFYISNAPADYVPYWYYPSNGVNTTLLRDSSAAAVTLSGLLDLSQQVTNDSDGAKYWLAAQRLFASLSSTNYLAVNATNAILLHANPVDANTDTSVIYGDYYFIESLKRFNDLFNQTTLTYIPATNFTGTDSFTYQACDSSGAVSTATVTVTVGSGPQVYTVAVSALPVAGGSVSGGGTFAAGSSVTVTATANTGYQFANWTEGATVVSGSASYTFPLSGNRTLVANFSGPVIATQPSSATVTVGGSASFSVVAAGSSLTYQWRFNGVAIAGATASSYTKANVQTTDAGNYDVLVSNGSATVASAVAVLTVVQPVGLINGSFESDYSGWTETGNQHITTGPPFTASDGTKAVVFSDGDRKPNGVLSQSFTTSPGQGYTVTFDVGVIGYNRNEQRLKVTVTGSTSLLSQTVSLFADGTGVLRWTTRSYSFVADSTTAKLTFLDQSPTTASLDITLDNVRVAAASGPVIATQPSSATVTVGGSASFSVVAAGSSLTYQWRFNGVAIAGATASSYTKANVQTTDAGNYDVLVSNGSATVASAVAVLTVVQPVGLINGSFESDYSGWTETGNQHITTGPPFTASDGTKAVVFSDGDRKPNGVLSQSFTTSPGQGYTVTFDVGVIGYNLNEQRLKVTVTGSTSLLSQTVSLFADGTGVLRWTTRSYSFVADSTTAKLTFLDQSPTTASLDITLDNVRLTANAVAPTGHTGASSHSSETGLMTLSSTAIVKPSISTAPTVQSSARSARDEGSGALFTLKVGSISPRTGVRVPVSPSDEDGAVEGVTEFTLHYSSGAVATIRAPWAAGGGIFSHWERDGVDVGPSVELSVTMDGDHQVDAVYQPASTPSEEDR